MEFPVKVVVKCFPNKPRTLHMQSQIRTFLDWSMSMNETDAIVYPSGDDVDTFYRQFATLQQAERFKRLILSLDQADPENAVVDSVSIQT